MNEYGWSLEIRYSGMQLYLESLQTDIQQIPSSHSLTEDFDPMNFKVLYVSYLDHNWLRDWVTHLPTCIWGQTP